MPELNTTKIAKALPFGQFRLKLIEFLKQPGDIEEPALRDVLERYCPGVYSNYLARAPSVEEIPKCEHAREDDARAWLARDHQGMGSSDG